MKISKFLFALAALTISTSAFASILETEDSATRVGGILISKGGKLSVSADRKHDGPLMTVGAGIRSKLGFMTIYVGELLVADKNKYACSEEKSLASLNDESAVAVKLTMNWGITGADLEDAFKNGFEANRIKVTPEIQKFLDSVKNGGAIPSGAKIVVAGERGADGKEYVSYENAEGKVFTTEGGAGLVNSIMALWVGKTRDGGLKDLRNNFVNCKIQ